MKIGVLARQWLGHGWRSGAKVLKFALECVALVGACVTNREGFCLLMEEAAKMISRFTLTFLILLILVVLGGVRARADLYSLRTSGTISSSNDGTIPAGTPFHFELTYETGAPDLDFEFMGSSDPTFGRFTNTGVPPALVFFHYQAGSYEVTLDDAADFAAASDVIITFTSVNAIDININAPTLFPHLAGGAVSFHADFNAFSAAPIFASDALPTNTAISAASFDESAVTLLPPSGVVTGSSLTSFSISAVQQPTIAGDYNNNGVVDAADYVVWRDNVGTTHPLVNDNGIGGVVRQLQYDLWRTHFGSHAAAGAVAMASDAVPEAGTHMLLLLAVTAAWARRCR